MHFHSHYELFYPSYLDTYFLTHYTSFILISLSLSLSLSLTHTLLIISTSYDKPKGRQTPNTLPLTLGFECYEETNLDSSS